MEYRNKILSLVFNLCVMISAENPIDSCFNIIKLKQEYDCNEENIVYNSGLCNGEITWTLTNSSLGLVEVEFNPCGNSNFKMILYVRDMDEDICDFNGSWKQHSVYNHRRIRNSEDDLPKCSQDVKVQLEYIFSGCYQIEVEANGVEGFIPRNLSTKYLDTQYVRYIFEDEDISAELQQRSVDNKTYLTTKFYYPHHSQIIELCFELENETEDYILVWNLSCPVENIKNDCRITIHGQNKNIACISKTLGNNIFNIECDLFELIPSNYSFQTYIVNEPIRCNTGDNSVWGNIKCRWDFSFNLTEEKLLLPNPIPNSNSSIYLIGISILVLISLILTLMYFLYKKIQKKNLLNNLPNIIYDPGACDDLYDEHTFHTPEILLFYPRDCETFMETMSLFRRMLKIEGNCQVFDIHDSERESEILTENPSIWLLDKIMDENIKIVLVLSKCGDYLIQEQKSYKNPRCIDSLYNYGVRIMLQNSHSFSRNKLFVTKFSFFEESRPTSILSPDRRYNLDDFDHVKVLMNGLFNNTELEENIQFNEKCQHLINFIGCNPNYLVDILNIT